MTFQFYFFPKDFLVKGDKEYFTKCTLIANWTLQIIILHSVMRQCSHSYCLFVHEVNWCTDPQAGARQNLIGKYNHVHEKFASKFIKIVPTCKSENDEQIKNLAPCYFTGSCRKYAKAGESLFCFCLDQRTLIVTMIIEQWFSWRVLVHVNPTYVWSTQVHCITKSEVRPKY